MRFIVIALCFCVTSAALAQSPDKGHLSGKRAQQASQQQRGTEKAPIYVQTLVPPKSKEDAQREAEDRQQKADLERDIFRVNVFQLVFNGLLVLTTLGMGLITLKAANAAEKSANVANETMLTMKDTAERQLRAYVSVETYAPTDVDGKRMEGKYGLLVKNRGQTPARKVRSWMAYVVREFPLAGPLASNTTSGSVAILSPGEEQVIINDWPRVSEADVAAVSGGKKAAYIFGEVLYEDVFGKERYTRFRLFQSGAGVGHQRLANYPEGNEAT